MPGEQGKSYIPTAPGSSRGDSGDEVRRLQAYLERFGYLRPAPDRSAAGLGAVGLNLSAPRAAEGEFDDATAAGLRRFQQFAGLPATGELDDATVAQMHQPRCGMPDLPIGGRGITRQEPGGPMVSAFVLAGRWPRTNLTYGFQNFSADLTEAQVRAAIRSALDLWSQVTPLRFTEAANPDIVIRFVAGDHGDGFPFDGASGVLAHAFYPTSAAIGGDTHFDEAEAWTVNLPVPSGGIDLMTVAAHEFGHALGLNHSQVNGALMFPFYGGPHRYLSADDVLGIQTHYGARIRAVPGWFGSEDQGADIAIADLDRSGRPNLVVFHVDNPGGDNHGYIRVGRDMDANGDVRGGWSAIRQVPGWFGWENQGAGIALADVNASGRADLVVFHVDNPAGENHGHYRIGWDLDRDGNVGGWSNILSVPGWFGAEDQGAAIAVADLNRNGRPDLVVFHLDNPHGDNHGYYRVGWDMNTGGIVTGGWSPVRLVPGWFGWENQGAGIAVGDIDRDGEPDLLVFHLDNPGGENHGHYRIGRRLDTAGNVSGGWGPITALPGWFGAEDQGAGVAMTDLNGTGLLDLVVFHVDNPGGENHGYYRVIGDL